MKSKMFTAWSTHHRVEADLRSHSPARAFMLFVIAASSTPAGVPNASAITPPFDESVVADISLVTENDVGLEAACPTELIELVAAIGDVPAEGDRFTIPLESDTEGADAIAEAEMPAPEPMLDDEEQDFALCQPGESSDATEEHVGGDESIEVGCAEEPCALPETTDKDEDYRVAYQLEADIGVLRWQANALNPAHSGALAYADLAEVRLRKLKDALFDYYALRALYQSQIDSLKDEIARDKAKRDSLRSSKPYNDFCSGFLDAATLGFAGCWRECRRIDEEIGRLNDQIVKNDLEIGRRKDLIERRHIDRWLRLTRQALDRGHCVLGM